LLSAKNSTTTGSKHLGRVLATAADAPPTWPDRDDDRWRAWLDAYAAGPDLLLRHRLPGDRFQPQGMGGHSMKLNEFMINAKVPREARRAWPLLTGRQGIAWVCGLRVDARAAVTAATTRVWRVQFER
jgi:tRNA(Ile)-lysidine synthetase-like protein